MEFLCKLQSLSLIFLLLSCSVSNNESTNIIGSPIDQAGENGSLQVFEENGEVYFSSYDVAGRRINFVNPKADALSFSPELGDASHAWLSTKVDGYAFDVSGSSVSLSSSGFQSSREVLKLAGTVKSWAVDYAQGYVAFVDEFFSIGIMQIDPSGQVLKQWTGGPIVNGFSTVIAGEMIDGGRLLLLVDGGALLVVDLAVTLDAGAWSFVQRDLGFQNPKWIGKVEGRSDRALVSDSSGMHLVDLTNGVLLQSLAIKSYLSLSKNGLDHASYYDYSSQNMVIVRANGPDAIQESRFKLLDESVSQSYLSGESLLIATESGAIIKYRLSDGLASAKYSLKGKGRIGLSEDYVAAMYDSALGAIEILNLESGLSTVHKAFNLSVLQK